MAQIAPSVLGADLSRLADEIASVEKAGITMLHLDIMDGHFVPNLSFGPSLVKTLDRLTGLYLDVHLMLSEPEKYFEPFVEAGADSITFHLEVHPEPEVHADRLRQLGVETGISINPDMPVDRVLPHLKNFDLFLLMSVFPGFGGQKFISEAIPRTSQARQYLKQHGLSTKIEVDGGVDESNAAEVIAAGADIMVMGKGFFQAADRGRVVEQIAGCV
jgi:ribulose-phosphate 3-epimerase